MRWLIIGGEGMLGQDLVTRVKRHSEHHVVDVVDRDELDITDQAAVHAGLCEIPESYTVVVNCAAWTDVDGAESHEAAAAAVNAEGPRYIAKACREVGSRLVQISTDYVFEGDATEPYTESAEMAPVGAYGRTKAAGEVAVREEYPQGTLVVRTAWLYGAHGACFPATIARLARERGSVSVVDDQIGQPTWTVDLAEVILNLVVTEAPGGTYHVTSSGKCSWFEFAREVVAAAGMDADIVTPTDSTSFPRPAARPAYSVLANEALDGVKVRRIGHWRDRWRVAAAEVLAGI